MAGVFKLILEASVSAGVLILLTLGVRLLTGRRPGIILPILSALIIVRLAIPIMIPSPLSLQNLFTGIAIPRAAAVAAEPAAPQNSVPWETVATPRIDSYVAASNEITVGDIITDGNSGAAAESETTAAAPMSFMQACSIAWIAGMVLMAAFIIFCNMRFLSVLKKNRRYDAPGFERLLEGCKEELGIRRRIGAVQVSDINTAAVYGIFRPKLLISPSFGWLFEEEKRNVLLHELSHIKRGDTVLSLLITVLNIVHWFNPLAWAALSLARKDIEVMCDMAVLKKTHDRRGYAGTLLNLAGTLPKKPRLAEALFTWGPQNGHFGVLISTYSIKRRITMIARYKKNPVFTALALVLTVAIAVTGCTGAVSPQATGSGTLVSAEPTNIAEAASPEIIKYDKTNIKYSGTYTLKDNSLSVSIPEGWTAKDVFGNAGLLINKDLGVEIHISSSDIIGSPQTPESLIDSTYITVTGSDGEPVTVNFEILSIQTVLVEVEGTQTVLSEEMAITLGRQGTVFEISAPLENGEEMHGLCAVITGTDKYYFCSMYSDKKDFENYEPLFYDVLDTLVFKADDWREKFSDKFTDGVVEKTASSYKSDKINVSIDKKEKDGAVYFVADIYVADIKYFMSAFAEKRDVMGGRELTDKVAKDNNAIVAINGDHCVDNEGTVVRNGQMYRKPKSSFDVLVMNYDGSMQTFSPEEFDVEKILAQGAYQVWSFGPMLLKGGQPMTDFNSSVGGANPRSAVGYYEPGHYCFVVVDGRQPGYSEGMTLEQLSQVFADLGCTAAYNMDGGRSAEMAFMGEVYSHPIDGRRGTTDIVYIGE